jgi:hypothetical protein
MSEHRGEFIDVVEAETTHREPSGHDVSKGCRDGWMQGTHRDRLPVLGAPSTDEVTALHPGVREPITWARSPSLSLVREERAQPEAVPSRRRARYH